MLDAELSARKMGLIPHKVIVLGGGELGWVDLWKGILVCNVLKENPVARFIPLPKLLPTNQDAFEQYNARQFRDVVCMDGFIKCVEMEDCTRRIIHETPDVSSKEILYDSELGFGDTVDTAEDSYEYLGWRIITWNRPISSNFWRKGYLVHVDEILHNNPDLSVLASELGDNSAQNLTLKELVPYFPTLSMDHSGGVHMLCKAKSRGQKTWWVTIDMKNKRVEELTPFTSDRPFFSTTTFVTSTLFQYLIADSVDESKIGGQDPISWCSCTSQVEDFGRLSLTGR